MSYEGYEQCICDNGHLYQRSCYTDSDECPMCGAETAFVNGVDDTNCDSVGLIPNWEFDKLKLTDAVVQTCNLGHDHVLKVATYRVPSEKEHKLITYRLDVQYDETGFLDFTYVRLHDGVKFDSRGKQRG